MEASRQLYEERDEPRRDVKATKMKRRGLSDGDQFGS